LEDDDEEEDDDDDDDDEEDLGLSACTGAISGSSRRGKASSSRDRFSQPWAVRLRKTGPRL
jgi:hypothetical protein